MRANLSSAIAVVVLLVAFGAAVVAVARQRARRGIATAGQRATYEVLHTAGLAAEPLRAGLTAASAGKAVGHLRALVGGAGLGRRRHRPGSSPSTAPASTTANRA